MHMWLVLGIGASVLTHEFGHLAALRAVGGRVRRFRFGWGTILWRTRRVEVRLIPFTGFVEPESRFSGWRAAVVAYSGVVAQWLGVMVFRTMHWVSPFTLWYTAAALVAVTQWLPRPGWDGGWFWRNLKIK